MARLAVVLVHITLTTLLTIYSDDIAGAFEQPDTGVLNPIEALDEQSHLPLPAPLMTQPLSEPQPAQPEPGYAEALVML